MPNGLASTGTPIVLAVVGQSTTPCGCPQLSLSSWSSASVVNPLRSISFMVLHPIRKAHANKMAAFLKVLLLPG
jgi:hypothetical protein